MLDKKSWDTPYVQYTLLSHMHGHLENAADNQGKRPLSQVEPDTYIRS